MVHDNPIPLCNFLIAKKRTMKLYANTNVMQNFNFIQGVDSVDKKFCLKCGSLIIRAMVDVALISCIHTRHVYSTSSTSILPENRNKFAIYNSIFLGDAISNYSRLRNYFKPDPSGHRTWHLEYYPSIIVAHTIAQSVNATLVSKDKLGLNESSLHPEFQYYYPAFWDSPEQFRKETYKLTGKNVTGFQLSEVLSLNCAFVYSDVPHNEKITAWEFSLFTDPLDWWTWLLLVIAFLFVAPLSGKFTKIIMPITSATLSLGTMGPPTKSKIFLAWMGLCMLVGNLYSGEITSKIMVPPKEEVMTHFRQLEQQNFTMILPGNLSWWIPGFQVKHLAKLRSEAGKVIQRLLTGPRVRILQIQKIPRALGFDDNRLGILLPRPEAQVLVWIYNHNREQYARGMEKKVERKCFVAGS